MDSQRAYLESQKGIPQRRKTGAGGPRFSSLSFLISGISWVGGTRQTAKARTGLAKGIPLSLSRHAPGQTRDLLRGLVVVLFLTALGQGELAPLDCFPVPEEKPPAKPLHDIWIEGEDIDCPAGWNRMDWGDCYEGKEVVLLTKTPGNCVLIYPFHAKESGTYLIRVAGQSIGEGWTSKISYSLDHGSWQEAVAHKRSKANWGYSGAVNWMNLALVDIKEGPHTLSLNVDSPRGDGHFSYAIDAISLLRSPAERLKISVVLGTNKVGNVFTSGEPVEFQFVVSPGVKNWEWVVTNWQGKALRTGTWRNVENRLRLPEIPLGYFSLKIREKHGASWSKPLPFAKVVDPATRKPLADCPYGLDSCLSWIPENNRYTPKDPRQTLADLIKRLGVVMVRDRISWHGTNGEPGRYRFDWYLESAEMMAQRGVQVCQVFHDSPEWVRKGSEGIPQDLLAVYHYAQTAGKAFAGKVQAWEFWNEEDAGATWPWNFAAALKAAYLGFKSAAPEVTVLPGANCIHPTPRYMELLMENGAGDYFDVFNFHLYKDLGGYEQIVRDKQRFLERFGLGHKPMWCTENGFASEGPGIAEPLVEGSSKREHDEDQERGQAEFLVKAQIVLRSLGVARDFSFVLKPYNEYQDGKVWGIIRWDWTVKPAYVALANMTAQLGECRYLGKMNLGRNLEGYLFAERDERQTLVFWSESKSGRSCSLSRQNKELERVDLMGQSITLDSTDGTHSLTALPCPAYLRGLKGLKPKTQTQTQTPRTGPVPAPAATQEKDLTVVLRVLPREGVDLKKSFVSLVMGKKGGFNLDIYNFSDRPKQVRLRDCSKGCTVTGLPQEVKVLPYASSRLPVEVTLTEDRMQGLAWLRVDGTCEGKRITQVAIPVMPDFREVTRSLEARPLNVTQANRWTAASSGQMRIEDDPAEKAVRFTVVFPDHGDRWVYPGVTLKGPKETLGNAVGVGFEIKCRGESVGSALLMAVTENKLENGQSYYFDYDRGHEWREVIILFESDAPASFDPAAVKVLQIGANPGIKEYTYWVRNMKVYYQK